MAIDESRLNDFMGRFVADLGAVMHAATIVVGDKLGLYKALAGEAQTAEQLGESHRDRRALPARVAVGAGRERLCRVRPVDAALLAQRGTGLRADGRGRPGLHPRRVRDRRGAVPRDPEDDLGLSHRPGPGLARARRVAVPRHRALLPPGLRRQPGVELDPGAGWRGGQARGRRQGRRRRLRARRLDADHGAGLAALELRRLRLPRALDPARHRGRAAGRAGRSRALRGGAGQGLPRPRLRPGGDVRLPARHGRPERRRRPCARMPEARRQLADRRALRAGRAGGQPEPGRTHLLFGLDLHLHAGLAGAGSRRLPGCAGRRGAHPRSGHAAAASAASAAPRRRRSTWSTRPGRERPGAVPRRLPLAAGRIRQPPPGRPHRAALVARRLQRRGSRLHRGAGLLLPGQRRCAGLAGLLVQGRRAGLRARARRADACSFRATTATACSAAWATCW